MFFCWMLCEYVWQIVEDFGFEVEVVCEFQEGKVLKLIVDIFWVQECDNQCVLFEGFYLFIEFD